MDVNLLLSLLPTSSSLCMLGREGRRRRRRRRGGDSKARKNVFFFHSLVFLCFSFVFPLYLLSPKTTVFPQILSFLQMSLWKGKQNSDSQVLLGVGSSFKKLSFDIKVGSNTDTKSWEHTACLGNYAIAIFGACSNYVTSYERRRKSAHPFFAQAICQEGLLAAAAAT